MCLVKVSWLQFVILQYVWLQSVKSLSGFNVSIYSVSGYGAPGCIASAYSVPGYILFGYTPSRYRVLAWAVGIWAVNWQQRYWPLLRTLAKVNRSAQNLGARANLPLLWINFILQWYCHISLFCHVTGIIYIIYIIGRRGLKRLAVGRRLNS